MYLTSNNLANDSDEKKDSLVFDFTGQQEKIYSKAIAAFNEYCNAELQVWFPPQIAVMPFSVLFRQQEEENSGKDDINLETTEQICRSSEVTKVQPRDLQGANEDALRKEENCMRGVQGKIIDTHPTPTLYSAKEQDESTYCRNSSFPRHSNLGNHNKSGDSDGNQKKQQEKVDQKCIDSYSSIAQSNGGSVVTAKSGE
ncbi:hypothetical protein ILUMI_03567 [Ignelater luminosus]|uniref:Uncharacterized protein n=1 Tax=Ignelater luminosus TaxID=2038154 RepID=A0A8K0DLJ0_IGNLU|nr:hypothetical protein ILUMI_03567 [Ignelater luminosus]